MVGNFWNNIHLYCGKHGDDHSIELVPHESPTGRDIFYSCPKYYPENREEGETACGNRLSMLDYENMVNKLSDMVSKAEMSGQTLNLGGFAFKNRSGVIFKVLKDEHGRLDILVDNKRSIG